MDGKNNPINDEFLLQCIANYKPLYDKSDKGYKSVIQKENCWTSVAKSLHTTVPAVKTRFKSLREKFRREVQIEEKLSRSGAPSSFRPVWPLMSFFKFMFKYGQEHRQTSSNFESEKALDSETTENVETEDAESNIEEIIIDYSSAGETDDVELCMAETPTPAPKKRKLEAKKNNESEKIDNVLMNVSSAIKSINQSHPQQQKKEDKYDFFGKYLSQELRELCEPNGSILMETIQMEIIKFKRSLRQDDMYTY